MIKGRLSQLSPEQVSIFPILYLNFLSPDFLPSVYTLHLTVQLPSAARPQDPCLVSYYHTGSCCNSFVQVQLKLRHCFSQFCFQHLQIVQHFCSSCPETSHKHRKQGLSLGELEQLDQERDQEASEGCTILLKEILVSAKQLLHKWVDACWTGI